MNKSQIEAHYKPNFPDQPQSVEIRAKTEADDSGYGYSSRHLGEYPKKSEDLLKP